MSRVVDAAAAAADVDSFAVAVVAAAAAAAASRRHRLESLCAALLAGPRSYDDGCPISGSGDTLPIHN